MSKRDIYISNLKLNLTLLVNFLEFAKPCLTTSEYEFYKEIISKIDFNRNIININHYIDFLMERILQTSLHFYG